MGMVTRPNWASLTMPDTRPRKSYIRGSDARTILGSDESALIRLWQEKRGELEPEDFAANLLVQFGCATEELNRRWFERQTGHSIAAVQRCAMFDGLVPDTGAVFEAKFMLPRNFAEDVAADKHMAQLQHSMLVAGGLRAYLSILTGGAKWVSIEVEADPPNAPIETPDHVCAARALLITEKRLR